MAYHGYIRVRVMCGWHNYLVRFFGNGMKTTSYDPTTLDEPLTGHSKSAFSIAIVCPVPLVLERRRRGTSGPPGVAPQGECREGGDHHLRHAHIRRARRLVDSPDLPHEVGLFTVSAGHSNQNTHELEPHVSPYVYVTIGSDYYAPP